MKYIELIIRQGTKGTCLPVQGFPVQNRDSFSCHNHKFVCELSGSKNTHPRPYLEQMISLKYFHFFPLIYIWHSISLLAALEFICVQVLKIYVIVFFSFELKITFFLMFINNYRPWLASLHYINLLQYYLASIAHWHRCKKKSKPSWRYIKIQHCFGKIKSNSHFPLNIYTRLVIDE